MSAAWVTIGLLCVITVAIKASGPVVLGARRPSERALAVIALLSPAVVTALVVYQTFAGHPSGLTVDARVAGLGAAASALAARLPMLAVMLIAAAVTAGVRALA